MGYSPDDVDCRNPQTYTEYLPGDEFSDICRITLAPEEEHDYASRSIPGPGEYEITWRRSVQESLLCALVSELLLRVLPNGEPFPSTTSRIPLPSLRPPTDGLIALLTVPPTAKLHVPITMSLKIRNLHPSRSANVTVQLELDAIDSFVVSGLRSGRIPIILPGGEEHLTWRLIPVECGFVRVPKIKVVDRRTKGLGEDVDGEHVKVVDVRWDRRDAGRDGDDASVVRRSIDSEQITPREGVTTVLVLP